MTMQTDFKSKLESLCDRYMERLVTKQAKPESIAVEFQKDYEPLALRAIRENPDNDVLFYYLGIGYHFFCNEEGRRFELAEHAYTRANRFGMGALAVLYWQFGRIDDARKAWARKDENWPLIEWWWLNYVDFPQMFEDVSETEAAKDFIDYAVAFMEEWPRQSFVLMLHGIKLTEDRWLDFYDYGVEQRISVISLMIQTYVAHLRWNSRGESLSAPDYLRSLQDSLGKSREGLITACEILPSFLSDEQLRPALARIKYKLELIEDEYRFIAEEQKIDRYVWSVKLPPMIDRIRTLRNLAAHKPDRNFSVAELNEVRAILWTRGLLYEVGELLRLCTVE